MLIGTAVSCENEDQTEEREEGQEELERDEPDFGTRRGETRRGETRREEARRDDTRR
jgi:hypothetical protein